MPDSSKCFSLVRGRVARLTALDGCGRIKSGACTSVVSEGIISIAFTANTEEGTAISVQNMAGKTCISDTPPSKFIGYGVEITFCEVNPDLIAMLTGSDQVYNLMTNQATGFRVNDEVDASDFGFALEVWSDVPGVACEEGAEGNFGYTLVPFLQGGTLGDFTFENDAVSFVVTGSNTKKGSGWGVGPYNVARAIGGTAAPLANPIRKGDHLHVELTDVAPPEAGCNCSASGVAPLTALRGAPGTFGPTDAYAPASYDGITDLVMPSRTVADGVTAIGTTVTSATAAFAVSDIGAKISGGTIPAGATITARASATSVTISAPATAAATAVTLTITQSQAWTTGQYVEAENGDQANWTGTAWAHGVHA